MLATQWGTGQVFLSMIWFTLFFIWIWLLILVFADIFRSHDMNGWVKAIWVLFVIVMPYLGVFVYLIARGHKMSEHAVADA
ncbi:MAG TPA: PLDc N-terminal domain-containing protein, partial [Acidimicrobiales bacterium]